MATFSATAPFPVVSGGGYRKHFADPHILLKMRYSHFSANVCDICRTKLAGLTGYRCSACDFDIHEACADYFKQTISFFAHPWHTLTLRRLPTSSSVRWSCDLCREECPQGHFVYSCVRCSFDVHPLCTMLPQTIRSPLHPAHDLCMVPASQNHSCSACRKDVDVWQYRCGLCYLRLHIACAFGEPRTSSGGQSTTTAKASSASASQTRSSGDQQQGLADRPSRRSSIAKFILKASLHIAMDAATGGMASPVLAVLSAAFS